MLEAFAVALLGIALAQATPGPNLLAVAGAALGQGRRTALLVATGVASALFVWVAAVAFGLGAVLALFPSLLTAMKLLGGAYLLFLAAKGLRAAWTGEAPAIRADARPATAFDAWRRGFLVNITNPKSALAWSAVATFLFGHGLKAGEVMLFAPFAAVSALLIYGAYATLFSSRAARSAYGRFSRWFEALFGLAFGLIGGQLVLDGLREVRA